MIIGKNNIIHETSIIPDFVEIGDHNRIGKNVKIIVAKTSKNPKLIIGDCNIINDNVKVIVGDEGVFIADWNVIHNDILIIGEGLTRIGHNCWFGQNTVLDGSGGLAIGNGVRVGMYSQIWTHVASGEQIEGCLLYARRKTEIQDDVWLVGSCVVSSGLNLGKRSICLANSVVTKDTMPDRVYSGAPAKLMEKAQFYKNVSLKEKFDLLYGWALEFASEKSSLQVLRKSDFEIQVLHEQANEQLTFSELIFETDSNLHTCFSVKDKTFLKKKTNLEIEFYTYLYNNKARFTPIK